MMQTEPNQGRNEINKNLKIEDRPIAVLRVNYVKSMLRMARAK